MNKDMPQSPGNGGGGKPGHSHPSLRWRSGVGSWPPVSQRHPRAGGDPSHQLRTRCEVRRWIPACAGMTEWVVGGKSAYGRDL